VSDLANNIQGEHFLLPATAVFWRVRRLKEGRGAPEVVFGPDGGPLLVGVEADFEIFRASVEDQPGRYRLDALDETRRPLEGLPPAYVAVPTRIGRGHAEPVADAASRFVADAAPPAAVASPAVVSAAQVHDTLLAEVIRGQNQLVALMTERFSGIMVSAAELLRVFPHQVLAAPLTPPPLPPPPAPPPPPGPVGPRNAGSYDPAELEADAWDDDDEPTAEDEAAPPESGMVAAMTAVNNIVGEVMPVVKLFMAHRMAKAGPKPRNAEPPVAEAPPAPAAAAPEPEPEPECGPLSLAELRHLDAVDAALTPSEARRHQLVTDDLPTTERRAWFDSLCSLDVDDAIAMIRRHIARAQRMHGSNAATRTSAHHHTSPASDAPNPPQEDTDATPTTPHDPELLTDSFDDLPGAEATGLPTCDMHGTPRACDGVTCADCGEPPPACVCCEASDLAITPEMLAHVMEVQAALTLDESAQVLSLSAEMPAEERDAWLAELSTFTVADAVQAVREALVGIDAGRIPADTLTGGSFETPAAVALLPHRADSVPNPVPSPAPLS
jgi:hypothetical protein